MGERGQLFVGRLPKDVRTRDLEEIFSRYGRMSRCEIKYGAVTNYAFVDYEDRRDAEDAVRYEDGRELMGANIVVEWSKGLNYRFRADRGGGAGYRGGRYDDYDDRSSGRRRSYSRERRRSRTRSRSRSRRYSRTPDRDRVRKRYSRSRSRSYSR